MAYRRTALAIAIALRWLGPASPARAAPSDPADYFPLPSGARWTYLMLSGGSNTSEVQSGTVNIGGVLTKELREIAGPDIGYREYYTNTGGIRLYRQFDPSDSAAIDYSPALLLATNPIDLGSSSTTNGGISFTLPGFPAANGTYSLSWQITARGALETPAGFFCDAIKRHHMIVAVIEGDTITDVADQYLVRGVGLVAETGTDPDGAPYASTLTSTTLALPPPDRDCDGIADSLDTCPYYANAGQQDADRNGRGDACECGDQDGNARVNVSDLVAINLAIFTPARVTPLCDSNNDQACNVADIVSANRTIFAPKTSTCARQPVAGP